MDAARTAARLRALRAQAAAAALVDVGRRQGLFVVLAGLPASTCAELAARAGVDERWLGDWLDGLVVAGLVDHDGAHRTYRIDAALAHDDDVDDELFAVARALVPDVAEGLLLVDVGDAAEAVLTRTRARLAPGERVAVAVVDAARAVSDNLDHPLGAALYARALAQRAHGRGGLIDERSLVRAFTAAGLRDVVVQRRRGVLVVAGRA